MFVHSFALLADRTDALMRQACVRLSSSVTLCIVAKRCAKVTIDSL